MIGQIRHRLFQVLEAPGPDDRLGHAVQLGLIALIILNVIAVMVDSVEDLSAAWGRQLWGFEVLSVAVFTVEYLLRFWVVPGHARFQRPILGRIRYILTPLALVDLVAILPFYLPMLMPTDLLFIRVLRLMRLMRLLKIGRYSESVRLLVAVVRDRRGELVATFVIVAILVVLASGLMYLVERDAQPQAFSSMPATMWWAVATVTTIGYGDMYPITPVGKVLAGFVAILGIGLFALPAGILGSGFVEKYYEKRRSRRCPHCGKELDGSEKS
jgi:voltage-gated potassium channel